MAESCKVSSNRELRIIRVGDKSLLTIRSKSAIVEEECFRINLVGNYTLLLPYYLIKAKGYRLKTLKIR